MNSLADRIKQSRLEAGLSKADLARAVGKSRTAVTQWESGDVRPRHATLSDIASATGKSLSWLTLGSEDRAGVPGLLVVGEVAAGTWKEGNVHFASYMRPVSPHPDYPWDAQRLYLVSGNSINKIAGDGEYLHTVNMAGAGIEPQSGDVVIVRRTNHDLTEYAAKLLIKDRGRWLLRPQSTDPQFQKDIEFDLDRFEDTAILDLVIAKWSPIPRGNAGSG